MKKIFKQIKYLKIKDFLSIFIFIITIIPACILKKINRKEIWLICESKDTAADNGYHLYKYLKNKDENIKVYYVIDKKAKDYRKIKEYGNIIQYGSLKHWIFYLAATKNISTQKSGNPNAPLFYCLQNSGILKNKRIFLQHGITKDDAEWLYYNNTKFRLFICGAQKEYEYIKEKFGYPEENVVYTGFARFDALHNVKINKNQVLIIPTWREWIGREKNILGEKVVFTDTEYFKKWNGILNNKKLIEYIEKNNITLYFYLHLNMQKFSDKFKISSKNIKIVKKEEYDVQTLLKESALMITDYSSVFMDFAYMKKPIIFYQFDKEEYRRKQYKEGYFSYEKDGFGPVYEDEESVVNYILTYINNKYLVENKYKERMEKFFFIHDNKNCERIYKEIKKI